MIGTDTNGMAVLRICTECSMKTFAEIHEGQRTVTFGLSPSIESEYPDDVF